ncbi:uncharacterized protein LOC108110581 [Drosophila eugracilis]|uniref:uncharacterized protein LOC108110581 n=1 Tax=Drosophila eugracilis TaxID=29029 RepID=UPI001BD92340|nr:uncharacterized protein LOC108110581 [Drosophila eugracilis]
MESSYIIAMLISIFCHCIGLFYNPIEASTESTVFLIIAIIFLHKLKTVFRPNLTYSQGGPFLEVAVLCLAMQVLLVAMWFPVYQTLQFLVNFICGYLQGLLSDDLAWLMEKINQSAVTVVLLAMEFAVLLTTFQINDLQRFFGCKEDCLSESVLSLVDRQEMLALRREKRLLQKEGYFKPARK